MDESQGVQILYSWSYVESDACSHWLIYGQVAMAKSKVAWQAKIKKMTPALPNQSSLLVDIFLTFSFKD